ncbi:MULTISPECIES: hypothetical protein [unclassified Bradyrhizobium]|uniref:hypothetical protein n=1 Tax=unclassified Bradyrhizobium TaxID=2631580 RepID=UPI001FF956D9|nr:MULTISPECIES: hypothetical protein [unclassified Bradyrhizobium]MCK1271379.1 hypothetical protein [Bradyrhizobium sp. 84]MCK1375698.1 hypothetical protein [Bradyrhizobium sp. 49]MCK1427372.1 hypothetical protein [Bradyrhizobium sp. 87]
MTGEDCRTSDYGRRRWIAISPRGLGLLTWHGLWQYAAQCIAQLDAVHPDAQARFLNVWMRVGWRVRSLIDDDPLCFALLRKLLPPYDGGQVTLYRGQITAARLEPSWTRSPHIALKFALWGVENVDPIRLATKGLPVGGHNDAVVLKATVPASSVICAPCLLGQPEGEYVIDPRWIEFETEPARDAAIWIRKDLERLFLRTSLVRIGPSDIQSALGSS